MRRYRLQMRSRAQTRPRPRLAGFSLLEQVFSITLLMLTIGATTQVFQSASGATEAHSARLQTVEALNRALRKIINDLKFSGSATQGTQSFPAFFEDGTAGSGLALHAHEAPHPVQGGGVTAREIVFLRLQGSSSGTRPDIDADGNPVWGAEQVSYVLMPQGDGTNRVERRVNGVLDEVVLRNVQSMTFDDRTSSGFTIPFGSVQVSLTGSRLDSKGRAFTETVSGIVTLRNADSL